MVYCIALISMQWLYCKSLIFLPRSRELRWILPDPLTARTEFQGPGQPSLGHTVAISTLFAFPNIQNHSWWKSDRRPLQGKLLISSPKYPTRVSSRSKDSIIKPTRRKHFILCVRQSFCSWRWILLQVCQQIFYTYGKSYCSTLCLYFKRIMTSKGGSNVYTVYHKHCEFVCEGFLKLQCTAQQDNRVEIGTA